MGGAERVVYTVAKEAAYSGLYDQIDIFVLCWSRTGTLDDLERHGNLTLHYTEAVNERGGVWPMIRFMACQHFSLVFSSSTHINALASFLRRLGCFRTDRLVARESTVIFDRNFGLRGCLFRALYWLYGAQDLIICQTDRMRQSLDFHTKGRFRPLLLTLPNPIDFDRIEEGRTAPVPKGIQVIPAKRTKIVWCGRLSPVKAPERAIDVLLRLHSVGETHMHLVVIGGGPLLNVLKEKVRTSGLSKHVTFMGNYANPCEIMSRCEIGLVTSDTEGFPNVILEMLASGVRRIVTTNCAGGLDELPATVVVENGPTSSYDLAAALGQEYLGESLKTVLPFLEKHSPNSFLSRIT